MELAPICAALRARLSPLGFWQLKLLCRVPSHTPEVMLMA